jgi:IMP dehydrogenase/GMP reductase
MNLVMLIADLTQKGLIEVSVNPESGEMEYTMTPKGELVFSDTGLSFEDVSIIPKFNPVKSRKDVDLTTKLSKNITIPTPLIASNMSCVVNADFIIKLHKIGVTGFLHRFYPTHEILYEEVDKVVNAGALAVVSCGVKSDDYDMAKECLKRGASAIVVDIAHGCSSLMVDMAIKLNSLKKHHKFDLILGNICTGEAVETLAPYASALKVGISNGSICATQHRTGAGRGQLTSVIECASAARKYGIPIISDGGICEASDAVKALVAGASSCMGGKIFARCPESAAEIIQDNNGNYFKLYYGMASSFHKNRTYSNKDHVASEGIVAQIPIGASCDIFVPEFLNAMRSGFTYCGASNIESLWENGELSRTSQAAFAKGLPHVVDHPKAEKISN